MKISKLIEELSIYLKTYGDIEVKAPFTEFFDGWGECEIFYKEGFYFSIWPIDLDRYCDNIKTYISNIVANILL